MVLVDEDDDDAYLKFYERTHLNHLKIYKSAGHLMSLLFSTFFLFSNTFFMAIQIVVSEQ